MSDKIIIKTEQNQCIKINKKYQTTQTQKGMTSIKTNYKNNSDKIS